MFRAGQQIGIYILINHIGRGGFGEVWLAERRAKFATTQVAVKLPLDEQVDHATIEQEAQLWAQASGHPNVLPIIEANDYDGQIVIVSEYAPDGSLEQLLKNNGGALPVKRAVELTTGILNGLEFLHSRKIIHRDLKPANILLQGDTSRLADFGISRAMRTTSVSANIAGTPKYMPPEAFDGKRNVQTDVWSIGVLLYQMLAGRLPFPQDHYGELIGAIVTKEPAPLPDALPASLRKAVAKALSKNPADRHSSAREMRGELDGKVEEPSISTVIRPVPPPPTPKRTNPLYFALPIVALLLLTIIGGSYWSNNKPLVTSTTNRNTSSENVTSPASATNQNTVKTPSQNQENSNESESDLALRQREEENSLLYELITACLKKQDYKCELENSNKLIELGVDVASGYDGRAEAYEHLGNYKQAIEDCAKAIELKPDESRYYATCGSVYRAVGNYDQAIKHYTTSLQLEPIAHNYFIRGFIYSQDKENQDQAIKDFTRAIELKADVAAFYTNRGLAYDAKGDYERAITDLRKSLQLDPDNEKTKGFLKAILNERNQ